MELTKDTYTKQEVQELIKGLQDNITELTAKLEEGNKVVKRLAELEKTNVANAIKLEMIKAGLDESFFDLVESEDVEKAQEKINKLVDMKKKEKIDNSFKPEDRKTPDEYATFEKNGNVEGMLKSKISKLF